MQYDLRFKKNGRLDTKKEEKAWTKKGVKFRASKNWNVSMFLSQTCDVPKILERIKTLISNLYALKYSVYFLGIKLPTSSAY